VIKHLIAATLRKKGGCGEKKRNVDDFITGNIRQVICRKYSKDKIH
jgi:hypothetical protein